MKTFFNCLSPCLKAFANRNQQLYPTNGEIGATYDISNIAGWFIERKGENYPPLRFARPTCLRGTIGWRGDILL